MALPAKASALFVECWKIREKEITATEKSWEVARASASTSRRASEGFAFQTASEREPLLLFSPIWEPRVCASGWWALRLGTESLLLLLPFLSSPVSHDDVSDFTLPCKLSLVSFSWRFVFLLFDEAGQQC